MEKAIVQPRAIEFSQLKEVTEELQSGQKRDSSRYHATVLGIAQALNELVRGVITKIDVGELQEQLGHLLYFNLKTVDEPVPFDVEHLDPLKSHFKNPTIIVLKRIRRYLMASHRKILARLEEDQARERRLDFHHMDINQKVKKGLEEMQRFQTMASLTPSASRKLDILTKALHLPARFHSEFRLLDRILDDAHHLRNKAAMAWLQQSMYSGSLPVLRRVVKAGLELLEKKSEAIFEEMERISGIPFDRNTADLEPGFTWFSLGTPLRRGEEFVRIFEHEEHVEHALRRLTFFMVRASWDAAHFRDQIDRNLPKIRERQQNCTNLAKIYFELERKIVESTNPGSEAMRAIEADHQHGQLSQEEAEQARQWVSANKAKLQELKLEVFRILADQRANYPDVALPEVLEALLAEPANGSPATGTIPRISILDLHREVEAMEERAHLPDAGVLVELCGLRERIEERKGQFGGVAFQKQVRAAYPDFARYEEKLVELDRVEARLDEMRLTVERWICEAWREVMFVNVDETTLDQAFGVVMDNMLASLKMLDYSVIDADTFKEYFEQALTLDTNTALFQLDQLLHEVHSIPQQNQILPALSDWENTLSRKEFEEKQSFILENEIKLQTLVDEVRAELRERIAEATIKPRRLRFEVFSLADCFAGNLSGLLKGLLRMSGKIASEREGERLIANIQAIESQIIEAQRVTKPNGEAFDKLKELKRLNLLPVPVIDDLYKDLEENFAELDQLLHDTNKGLEQVRTLQNRFGGSFETAHLDVIINIHDLESLKKIYHFVDAITMMDIKRFGVIYKQKNSLMQDLYDRANRGDEEVPAKIRELITAKVYKQYKQSHVVPLMIKTEILKEMPDILDFEGELLIRTLNLVDALEIRNKSVYRGILQIVAQAKGASRTRRLSLRRIWVKIRSKVLAFKPRNFKANYDNNTRALITDVQNTVGSLFEDL